MSDALAAVEPIEFPDPVPLPNRGQASSGELGGQDVVYYTMPEAAKQIEYVTALKGNHEIALLAAPTIRALETQNRAMLEVVRRLEERANTMQEWNYQKSVELAGEKRDHLVDNLLHRVLFLVLLAVGL